MDWQKFYQPTSTIDWNFVLLAVPLDAAPYPV